tara:strand:+ start:555 stop:1040 length:486 start_codon:yes stop_codon:yes gene_type:complete
MIMIEDLQTKGYIEIVDTTIADTIPAFPPLSEWSTTDEYVEYPQFVDLKPVHEYIGKTYVEPFATILDYGYNALWNKTDEPSMHWHNDLVEGCNLFFMFYLTDVTEGGELMFRVNNKVTGIIQPKRHLLVMASQEAHVEHKVNLTEQTRIVCNFGFNVQWT